MKRFVDEELNNWKNEKLRRPLLLRGARQVGKTFSVRKFGKKFESFVEINLEIRPDIKIIFEKDFDIQRILRNLSLISGKQIFPGKTLLFIDEIQASPAAITSLRYFYENLPDLHVIAAGSLLDFAIENIGIPVGRVESLYMYPMSFIEFLLAMGHDLLVQEILKYQLGEQISQAVHNKILSILGEYLAIGGMPGVVECWRDTKNPARCFSLQNSLIDTYRQDFSKYAKKFQIKYVDTIFNNIPAQIGKKFKYSVIDGDYRKRELAPALDLLITAGIAHKIISSHGQGLPLGAHVNFDAYKIIFLDVALCQVILGLDLEKWFLNPEQQFVNRGELLESFIGQEILAYSNFHTKKSLYYWQKNSQSSTAEVDYLVQVGEKIIPVEVKSGAGSTLKSLHMFLRDHTQSPYGIRFSTQNYSKFENIESWPLYAVAAALKFNKQI